MWSFPDTLLAANSYLVVWCDDDEDDGPMHATFKLSADGEDLALFGRLAAGNSLIDHYAFGAQTTDISEGRFPDAADTWFWFEEPSPGSANASPTGINEQEPVLSGFTLLSNYPNPFNPTTTIRFALDREYQVDVVIFNSLGEKITSLLSDRMASGSHELLFDARGLPSGVYYCRLSAGNREEVQKMLVLK